MIINELAVNCSRLKITFLVATRYIIKLKFIRYFYICACYRSVVCVSVRIYNYICRLSHSCILLKPLDGMRCRVWQGHMSYIFV